MIEVRHAVARTNLASCDKYKQLFGRNKLKLTITTLYRKALAEDGSSASLYTER